MIPRQRCIVFLIHFLKTFKKVTVPEKEIATKYIIMKSEKINLTLFCTLHTFYLNNIKCH